MTNKIVFLDNFDGADSYITFMDGINSTKENLFDKKECEVEVLFECSELDPAWDIDVVFAILKEVKTGYLGYYHYRPAGYSSYTYDPDITTMFYKTLDIVWFFDFALTRDLKDLVGVSEFIAAVEINEMLKGE
jgi:hypothetical protein